MNRIERAKQLEAGYIKSCPETLEHLSKRYAISPAYCLREIAAYSKYMAKQKRRRLMDGIIEEASYIDALRRYGPSPSNWGELL